MMKAFTSGRRRWSLLVPLVMSVPAWACLPPPPVNINPAPAGPEGLLPVVKPVLIPAPPWDPKLTPCPGYAMHTDQAPLVSISDADYLRLFTGTTPLPTPAPWSSTQVYNAGEQVSFDNLAWRAKWWTQNEQPGPSWGAWEALDTGTGPQQWSATRTYTVGNQVVYAGLVYQAKWWTQGDAPGADPYGPWEHLVGVTPPSGLPQAFQANLIQRRDQGMVSGYELFINTTLGPRVNAPSSWKVHVDGQIVASGSQFAQLVSDCPPPQAGAPACVTRYAWAASTNLSASVMTRSSRVTVWLCAEDGRCRPTPQLWARFVTAAGGNDNYPPAPTPTPGPTPTPTPVPSPAG